MADKTLITTRISMHLFSLTLKSSINPSIPFFDPIPPLFYPDP